MFEYILSFGTVRCVSSKCIIELIFKLILDKFSSLFKSLFLSVLHRWAILGNQFVMRSDIFVILWQVSLQVHRGRGLAH